MSATTPSVGQYMTPGPHAAFPKQSLVEARALMEKFAIRHLPVSPERALCHVLLTNTVPYKPRGNRTFPSRVREAFRPYLECILVCRFRGDRVLALGNEAFEWFARYADDAEVKRIRGPGRLEGDLRCSIVARCHHRAVVRVFRVCPLPHPSPANARYVRQLPALLARRLRDLQLGK